MTSQNNEEDFEAKSKIPYVILPVYDFDKVSPNESGKEKSLKRFWIKKKKSKSKKSAYLYGRERFKTKLRSTLTEAVINNGGCFLVGGYRGVGKTYLVDKVIHQLTTKSKVTKSNENKNPLAGISLETIKIDLGVDSELSTRDILCDLTESLHARSAEKNSVVKKYLDLFQIAMFIYFPALILSLYHFPYSHKSVGYSLLIGLFANAIGIGTLAFIIVFLLYLRRKYVSKILKNHSIIKELTFASRFAREWDHSSSISAPPIKNPFFQTKTRLNQEPISARRVQQELINYFKKEHEDGRRYIIVFDEVDKINPSAPEPESMKHKSRKQKVDELLGGLKALMNNSNATFIVVAGREIVDAYYSESGYTSVLYESVFDDIFYIPTLLTDWSDNAPNSYTSMLRGYVHEYMFGYTESGQSIDGAKEHDKKQSETPLKELIAKMEDAQNSHSGEKDQNSVEVLDLIFYYETFIKYLTLHCWGNFRRLQLMLRDHTEYYSDELEARFARDGLISCVKDPSAGQKILLFTPTDIKRMFVSARLYALFEVHLGRVTSKTDDKAAVSSLITILDIFRFHSRGFSRPMIDRTVAGIDVHTESSLAYIADDYLHSTFQSMIRRTSNNIFPYRFYLSTDMELSYFAKMLGAKSSSFEFALDSAEPVREFYMKEAIRRTPDGLANSSLASAKLQAILGDLYSSEHKFDMALTSYSNTLFLLKKLLRNHDETHWKEDAGVSLESQYMLIRTLLKKGIVEESRENNKKALAIYSEAEGIARTVFDITPTKPDILRRKRNVEVDWHYNDVNSVLGHFHSIAESVVAKLAMDFVEIKAGRKTKLENFFTSYSWKELSEKPSFKFLSKYLSAAFYSGHYKVLIEQTEKNVEENPSDYNAVDGMFRYVDGYERNAADKYICAQILFSSFADDVRAWVEMIEKHSELRAFFLFWAQCVLWLSNFDHKQNQASDEQWLKELELLTFIEAPLCSEKQQKEAVRKITKAFIETFRAADLSKKQGKHADAAHQYSSMLLNWIAVLELVSWKDLVEKCGTKNFSDIRELVESLQQKPEWIDDAVISAQDCVEKADRSANIAMRGKIINDYKLATGSKVTSSLRVTDILSQFEENNVTNEARSTLIWCRSNLSNYLLMFGIWEDYCRYSIIQWCVTIPSIRVVRRCATERISETSLPLDKLPSPVGNLPRVRALYCWLRARHEMHTFHDKYRVGFIDKYNWGDSAHVELKKIIELLVESLDEYRKAFRSDDPDSFPSKSHIYFNLNELLKLPDIDKLISEIQKDSQDKRDDELFYLFLESEFVSKHLDKHSRDLQQFNDATCSAFKRKIRHKYFLYDDFDDPFLLAEWSHLRLLSSTARLLTSATKRFELD
ncbi:MAG: ATP-binding protein [Alteromonadaceae bacterium]|nr:ATP-binding protein [Alteromonadaceae bacterium]